MKEQHGYVPPPYIPLEQLNLEETTFPVNQEQGHLECNSSNQDHLQWSTGICACFDDMPSCCIGLFCPCILFGKNAEFLGSGTLAVSCTTYFLLWALVSTLCCFLTDGLLLGASGSFIACYTCRQRGALRSKYNLPEAPCRDLTTHLFCHLCALCQEYREIQGRAGNSSASYFVPPVVTAPPVQVMNPNDWGERRKVNTV